jgi:hypothetical protein
MNPKTYNSAKEFMAKTELDQIETSITVGENVEQLPSSNKSLIYLLYFLNSGYFNSTIFNVC